MVTFWSCDLKLQTVAVFMHMKMTSTNSSCPTTHVQARCHARDPTTGTGAGRHKKECVGTGTSAVCQVRIAGAKVPESNVLDNINMKIVSCLTPFFFICGYLLPQVHFVRFSARLTGPPSK